jgi:hypothetical protein
MVFYLIMVLHAVPVEMWQPYATHQDCNEAGDAALTELHDHGHKQAYYFCLQAPKEEPK